MKVTFLGQAGLLLETEGLKIMIDPYLSDSVGQRDPMKHRRVPVNERFYAVEPDVMVFTHNHLDHFDPDTVERIITPDTALTVLAPASVWHTVRRIGGKNNFVLFDRHTQWTEGAVRFTAVKAAHSDDHAIGVLIEAEGKTLYITGDTLYSTEIFNDLPDDIDVVFLPVNGVGNNMNMIDAVRFARQIGAAQVAPIHIGLFDDLRAEQFECENKIVLEMYKELAL